MELYLFIFYNRLRYNSTISSINDTINGIKHTYFWFLNSIKSIRIGFFYLLNIKIPNEQKEEEKVLEKEFFFETRDLELTFDIRQITVALLPTPENIVPVFIKGSSRVANDKGSGRVANEKMTISLPKLNIFETKSVYFNQYSRIQSPTLSGEAIVVISLERVSMKYDASSHWIKCEFYKTSTALNFAVHFMSVQTSVVSNVSYYFLCNYIY